MDIKVLSASRNTLRKIWVAGRYYKSETYNYNGDLVSATLYRPDLAYSGYFTYGQSGCSLSTSNTGGSQITYGSEIGVGSPKDFVHMDDAEYNGKKCFVYYDINKTYNAYYVDEYGFLLGHVQYMDDPERWITVNYTYHNGLRVDMGDFTFSKSYCYRSSDDRVFHAPSSYYGRCAASTTSSMLALVVAAVAVAASFVF